LFITQKSDSFLMGLNLIQNKMKSRTLGDYDIWYQKCERCGYDTGKSTPPKEGNKTCWRCGNYVRRDYSDRALKGKIN